MKQAILLGAIRAYWRFVPARARAAMSPNGGTSEAAYRKIRDGAGILEFVTAALPLRKLFGGTYAGQGDW